MGIYLFFYLFAPKKKSLEFKFKHFKINKNVYL